MKPLMPHEQYLPDAAGPSDQKLQLPPLISVIVPVYNVEDHLRECLDSLERQDDPNFEVVIIDDGSTDGCSAIIAEYCARNVSFSSHRQDNAGLGAARNKGVQICSGEFVTFVDSDDWVSDSYVKTLRREQARENFDVVSASFCRVAEAGALLNEAPKSLQKHALKSGVEFSHAESVLGVFSNSVAWGRLYRKNLLESHNLEFPGRLPHEDWYFTYKTLMLCDSDSAIPDIIYYYRQREGAISKSLTVDHVNTLIEQWEDADRFFSERASSPHCEALIARRTIVALKGMIKRFDEADPQTKQYLSETILRHRNRLIDAADALWLSGIEDRRTDLSDIIAKCERFQMSQSNGPTAANLNSARLNDRILRLEKYQKNEKPHPLPEIDRRRLAAFHNAYEGERCFIIGNGPSLNKHDLSKLENEYTFGVNSFFYKTDETGFRPTFFVVEDNLVMNENIERIKSYVTPFKFFPIDYESLHPRDENVFFFPANWGYYVPSSPNYCVPRFSTDATKELFCGQTVTYINMQLAYFMGFKEVYLIGMDFDYVIPKEHGRKGNWIFSTTDDPNHFHKDYFGKGKTWKDPKLDRVSISYELAKLAYEATGRKLCNASIGGKLEIFERIDYESLLRDSAKNRRKPVELDILPQTGHIAVNDPDNKSGSEMSSAPPRKISAAGSGQTAGAAPGRAFALLRFMRRALAGVWRRRALTAPATLLLAGFVALGFLPAFAEYQLLIWTGAGFAAVLFALFYLALRAFHIANVVTTLGAEAAALRKKAGAIERRLDFEGRAHERHAARAANLERAGGELRRGLDRLASEAAASQAAEKALKSEHAKLAAQAAGLDIVSAARALRPLWTGESAAEILKDQGSVEHGHALMMAALAELEQARPATLKGRTLIEIGATRELDPAQKSTQKLAIFTAMTGMRFVTVDMDPHNIDNARRILRLLNPAALAIAEKGEDFLASYTGPIDFIYLDAFDFDHGKHSQERQNRYRSILNTDISDEACWRMHEQCAKILIGKLSKDGFIVIDDTWPDDEGRCAGKGKLAVPLLLDNGFEIFARASQAVALRRA